MSIIYRVHWKSNAKDTPNGFSLHKTADAAADYIFDFAQGASGSGHVPAGYSGGIIFAMPVLCPRDGIIAGALAKKDSLQVAYNANELRGGDLYGAAVALTPAGAPVKIEIPRMDEAREGATRLAAVVPLLAGRLS